MASLQLPKFTASSDTWGPSPTDDVPFADLPFAPFTKSSAINYIADFTPNAWGGTNRRNRDDDERGGNRRARMGDDDAVLGDFSDNENDFHGTIVRTKKYDEHKGRKDWTAHRAKMAEAYDKLAKMEKHRLEHAPQSKFRPKQQKLRQKRRKKIYENPRPPIPSIKKQDSWQLQCDLWFNSMHELRVSRYPNPDYGTMNIVNRAGTLSRIRRDFDAIRCRTPSPLNAYRYSDSKYLHYDYVSASNDPILQDLAYKVNKKEILSRLRSKQNKKKNNNNNNTNNNQRKKWKVFTTDTIMALLMCIIRSKYSFDIVVTKIGQNLFIDQRNRLNSYWHVDETSQNRPTKKGTSNMNKHGNLCKEATLINHVLSEQIVSHKLDNILNLEKKHPFATNLHNNNNNGDSSNASSVQQTPRKGGSNSTSQNVDQPVLASKGFIYKTFDLLGSESGINNESTSIDGDGNEEKRNLEDDIRIYARCSAHGFEGQMDRSRNASKSKNISYVNVYGLNQYDHLKSKTVDWNKDLDQASAGILLTEIANNSFKMSRWSMESYLVGCDKLKIGFITRSKPSISDRDHHIVGVKTFLVKDMINKCKINLRHEWSILRHIIKLMQTFEFDGRYIGIRDPLKQVIRFYKVDDNAFGKDDELPSTKQIKKLITFVPQQQKQQQQQQQNDK